MDYSGIYTDLLNTAASYSDIAKDSVIIINTTQEAIDEVTKAAVYAEMGHYWPWKENAQDAIITSDIVQKYNLDKTDLASRPNIVYMLIDDLGWNDVNLIKESTFIPWGTPNIDILRDEGIVLTNYYAENQCTPSRASLMTGKYGLRIGQDVSETDFTDLLMSQTSTFSTSEVTLAQELKSAGYNTIGVGKWGLGFDEFAGIPTQSGFDHFYGYWNAMLDHRYKQLNAGADVEGLVNTIDFWDDELWLGEDVRVSSTADEDLIAYLISEKVDEYIEEYAQEDKPFFLYYSSDLVHVPYDTAAIYKERCINMRNTTTIYTDLSTEGLTTEDEELAYCGMILQLDEAVANVTCTLKAQGVYDNTIFIFASDNGGVPNGSNFPLTGKKMYFSEGGVKVPGVITGGYLDAYPLLRGTTYDNLMHTSDWLPTLMNIATNGAWTGSYNGSTNILDGIDHTIAIFNTDTTTISTVVPPRTTLMTVLLTPASLFGVYKTINGHLYKLLYGALLGNVTEHIVTLQDTSLLMTGNVNMQCDALPIVTTTTNTIYTMMLNVLGLNGIDIDTMDNQDNSSYNITVTIISLLALMMLIISYAIYNMYRQVSTKVQSQVEVEVEIEEQQPFLNNYGAI